MIEPVFKLVGDKFVITEGYGTITTSKTLTHSENVDNKVKMESEELEEFGQNRPGGPHRRNMAGKKTVAPAQQKPAQPTTPPAQPNQKLLPAATQKPGTQTGLARVSTPTTTPQTPANNQTGLARTSNNQTGLARTSNNQTGLARTGQTGLSTSTKPATNTSQNNQGLTKSPYSDNVEDAEWNELSDEDRFQQAKDVTATPDQQQDKSGLSADKEGTVADSLLKAKVQNPQQVLDSIVKWGSTNGIAFDPSKLGKLVSAGM